MRPVSVTKTALALAALPCVAAPAHAVDVTFSGLVINSCILTLDTPGVLAAAVDGTELNSELGTGVSSIMAVAALGLSPTVQVGVPVADEPAGQTGSLAEIKYTSLSGANQPYTSQATSTSSFLIDTFIFDARIRNDEGFVAGSYGVTTEVTCQQ